MEKEFVPYKLALALKALGFDEPCFGYHLTKDLPYVKRGLKFGSENYVGKHNSYDDFIVSAPTYSQAFRWFRENYNLKGFISPVEYLDGTDDTYHWCIYNECNSGNDQLTYEEAELACLRKLIEIVETKSE